MGTLTTMERLRLRQERWDALAAAGEALAVVAERRMALPHEFAFGDHAWQREMERWDREMERAEHAVIAAAHAYWDAGKRTAAQREYRDLLDTGPPLGPEPSPYARPIALRAPLPFPPRGAR